MTSRREWEHLTPQQRHERVQRSLRDLADAFARAGVTMRDCARALEELAQKFHAEKIAKVIGEEHCADPEFQRRVLIARRDHPEISLAGHMIEVAAEMWPDD